MRKHQFISWVVLSAAATFGCSKSSAPPSTGPGGAEQTAAGNRHPDYKNLQGEWKIVSSEYDGDSNDPAVGNLFTFEGGKLTAWIRDIGHVTMAYELDPTKQPKHLTAKLGNPPNDMVYTAIYELDGDNLKLCFRERDRPTDFRTKVGSFWISHVFKRTDGTE